MRELKIVLSIFLTLIIYGCGENQKSDEAKEDTFLDLNNDGVVDVFYEHEEDGYYELVDRNFDSKIDESSHFGLDDRIISSKADDNFDGILETKISYLNGSPSKVKVDTDKDGVFDLVFTYKDGVALYGEKFYEKGSKGDVAKIGKVTFEFGYPSSLETLEDTNITKDEFEKMHSE